MSACRSCGAPIRWARTTARKNIPLDPEPVAHGNVRETGEWDGPLRIVEVLGGFDLHAAQQMGNPLYVSHFATCPNADQHRRTA